MNKKCDSQLQNWLADLGIEQGCYFILSPEGKCDICANNTTIVHLIGPADSDEFNIHVELTTANPEMAVEQMRKALSLNLFQEATHGATIALNAKTNTITLCYIGLYSQSSYQEFINILNNMIRLSTDLTRELNLIPAEATDFSMEGQVAIRV